MDRYEGESMTVVNWVIREWSDAMGTWQSVISAKLHSQVEREREREREGEGGRLEERVREGAREREREE